jgi:hypothetical protein
VGGCVNVWKDSRQLGVHCNYRRWNGEALTASCH